MTKEKKEQLIRHLKYNLEIGADYLITDEDAIEIIKALEQTMWIPVSERLPNDEDYVLVCYEDGHIRTAYYYIDTNFYSSEFEDCCETGWYDYNEEFMYNQDVIAWMPLPQPYTAESEK